jgi:hypothetical protein
MSEKEEEIQVREEQDGSVTAELPEGIDNPQVDEDDAQDEQELTFRGAVRRRGH